MANDPSAKTRKIGQLPDKSDQLPAAIWAQPRTGFRWQGPVLLTPAGDMQPAQKVWTYEWESPWYDLRPDLISIEGQPKLGVPIWSRSARLFVELVGRSNGPAGDLGILTNNFTAVAKEYYDTTNIDPGQIITQGPGQKNANIGALPLENIQTDVTSTFFPPSALRIATSLGVFIPPGTLAGGGEGYPVRYWKVVIKFSFTQPLGAVIVPDVSIPPIVSLQATYY